MNSIRVTKPVIPSGEFLSVSEFGWEAKLTNMLDSSVVGIALPERCNNPLLVREPVPFLTLATTGQIIHVDLRSAASFPVDLWRLLMQRGCTVAPWNALEMLLALGISENVDHDSIFCVNTALQLRNAGLSESFGFSALSQYVFGLDMVPTTNPQDSLSCVLSPDFLAHMAAKAFVLRHAFLPLRRDLESSELTSAMALEMDVLPAIADMTRNGVPFDADRWKFQIKQNTELLHQVKEQIPSLSSDENCSSKKCCLSHRLAIYGLNFLTWLDLSTNRFYPNWVPLGTVTGRITCREPALQSLPRESLYRCCIRACDGYQIVSADWSHIDLRVAAALSGDEALLRLFADGEDPYRMVAAQCLQILNEDVSTEQRTTAKAICLGLLFGMQDESLKDYTEEAFDITLTLDKAKSFREAFFAQFSGLRRWQQQTIQKGKKSNVSQTPSGRRTFFTGQERKASRFLNYPVQATTADGLKASMILLHRKLKLFGDAVRIIMTLHDEIVLEVRQEIVDQIIPLVRACMEQGMQQFVPRVRVQVKIQVGADWGSLSPIP